MVLATLVLLCALPQVANDGAKLAAASAPAVETADTMDAPAVKLPDSPAPKLETSSASDSSAKLSAGSASETLAAPIRPASPAGGIQPGIKPAISGEYKPQYKKEWYALMFVSHSAAVFDAWSTRRAISGNYGTEGNPLLRPFSHSDAMYAATQVSPAIMDFLGRKMMTSRHSWMRKLWWVPQSAGASVSFASAAHNMSVVP
ncbi:MAG TPA: hypothetical protein VLV88_15090 [Terriglobales bacterium]|nr:hypothetical protein [Terriglobales bacterium]